MTQPQPSFSKFATPAMAFQDVIYEFTIFSADGSEFQRVGREGEGPGEYRFVFRVREHAGLLHVFDWKRRSITVLDSDLEVVGTLPVRCLDCNGVDMAMLPDGAVALNYFLSAAESEQPANANEGFALHVACTLPDILHRRQHPRTRLTADPAERVEGHPVGSRVGGERGSIPLHRRPLVVPEHEGAVLVDEQGVIGK